MGRPISEGLTYFPLDIDFFDDEKVQFVSARFGVKGDGIIVRLLCKIYRQGYAIKFDDDVALLFARSVGDINLHGLVKDIVNELLRRGFFDEGIFKRFGLLTSKGIQKRYTKICTDSKIKNFEIEEEISLLRSKPTLTTEETILTTEESAQRKEKERKEKERIVIGADAPKHPPKSIETFEKRETYFYNAIAEYKDVYPPKEILRPFFDYWREPNKSKSKMKWEQEKTWDLKLRLERWANNEFNKKNNQNGTAGVQNSGGISGKRPHDTSKMEPGTRTPL